MFHNFELIKNKLCVKRQLRWQVRLNMQYFYITEENHSYIYVTKHNDRCAYIYVNLHIEVV